MSEVKVTYGANNATAGRHFFIHNTLASVYRGILNWFGNQFYDRLQYKILGTYEKSVEFFEKKQQFGKEIDTPFLPALNLDPAYSLDFADSSGQMLWQKPYLAPGLGGKLWRSIDGLEEQDLSFKIVMSRMKGEFELTFWLSSIYEYFDMYLELLMFSGGTGRYMRPETFNSYIVIPKEFIDFEYQGKKIDWSKTDLVYKLLKAPNCYEYALPVKLEPYFKFTGISDSSTKYGGDSISEYKLSVSVEYELNLPTYAVLYTDLGGYIDMRLYTAAAFSKYGTQPVYDPVTKKYSESSDQLDKLYALRLLKDDKSPLHQIQEVIKYSFYEFTEEDVTQYNEHKKIVIPNPYTDIVTTDSLIKQVRILSYIGELEYEKHWLLINNNTEIEIYIKPIPTEIIELYKYQIK